MLKQFWGFLTIMGIGFLSWPVLSAPMTPRQAFYYHAHKGNLTALIQLKKMGYHIDVSDDYGNSALCEAVIKKDNTAIQTLIQAGADTNATCMQALSVQTSQNAPQQTPVISEEVNQQERLASPAATKVPNPPAEPLSKNTKVGIGLGVAAVAAAGTTVAILASGGGGGGSSHLNCVDGVQKGKSCVCNPHAIGKLCDSCEEGYGMHGTNSCHADKTCGTHAQQIGDDCVCEKGYDFKGEDGNCYKDLRCSQIYANMHQENGACVCDSGYNQYSQSGYAPTGCYKNLSCDSSKHFVQVNNSCLCEASYPIPPAAPDGSCSSCGVEGATWDGNQCNCPADKPVYDRKPDGTLNSCTACLEGTNYDSQTNTCVCPGGKIWYGGQCYTNLNCKSQAHSTGEQLGDHCECRTGYAGTLCTDCDAGYANVDGICAKVEKKADYNAKTDNPSATITMVNEGDETMVGLYGENESVVNAFIDTSNNRPAIIGTINITNHGKGDVYGMYGKTAYGIYKTVQGQNIGDASNITLINSGSEAYGIYAIDNAYGLYHAGSTGYIIASNISITDNFGGSAYGIYSKTGDVYGAYDDSIQGNNSTTTINIRNKGGIATGLYSATGDVYGIYDTYTTTSAQRGAISVINMYQWGGTAFGMQGKNIISSNDYTYDTGPQENTVNMYLIGADNGDNSASGKAVGMHVHSGKGDIQNLNGDKINLHLIGGNYKKDSTPITVDTDNTEAIGIYANSGVSVWNEKNASINIDREPWTDSVEGVTYTPGTTGTAYGIYVKGGSDQTIINEGKITISGEYDKAYGIYIEEGNGVNVINSGTISVNSENGWGVYFKNGTGGTFKNTGTISAAGASCSGTTCYTAQFRTFTPNGATTGDDLTTTTTSFKGINLASVGAKVLAGTGSIWQTEGAFSGPLYMDTDTVTSGFDKIYIEKDMIQAGDTSELELISDSALFDAKLAGNGKDVVMTMKGFDTATSNKSLADFLSKNYALGNNEAFYNKLKSFGDTHSLTDSLNKLTGRDMLSRFNFEDMTMMRELNFDMNEKLFHNKEQHFALAGSVSPMAFKGDSGSNARYSLFNKRDGNKSIGLGIAFTDVRSDDDKDSNNRSETSYQLILPMGYKAGGFNLVTSPRIGYARGTYDRTGFDEKTYDGTIEKRVFGLMNEARYPITVGKWKLEPSAEFNILGYQQKGHEDDKDYALNIQSQNTLSVEGGIGLYATREEELDKDTTLKLTAGMAAYHEFADPYRVKVGMNGMDGAFTLRDENRSDNRGVIRAGFDYAYRDLSLYGSLISYIDHEARTSAKTGMRVKF